MATLTVFNIDCDSRRNADYSDFFSFFFVFLLILLFICFNRGERIVNLSARTHNFETIAEWMLYGQVAVLQNGTELMSIFYFSFIWLNDAW